MKNDAIVLSVDGQRLCVPHEYASTRLIDVLRQKTQAPKLGCGEGGCGACAVFAVSLDADTGVVTQRSINSCLAPVGLCDGLQIITAEGLGNSRDGFSPVQEAMAKRFASQCGFCTPGIVVAVTAAAAAAGQSSGAAGSSGDAAAGAARAAAIAAGLDGNLCRCTGWRPIIDACKDIADLEDLAALLPCCKTDHNSNSSGTNGTSTTGCSGSCKTGDSSCRKQCQPAASARSSVAASADFPDWLRQHVISRKEQQDEQLQQLPGSGSELCYAGGSSGSRAAVWLAPRSLKELAAVLAGAGAAGRRSRAHLVAGNTGAGVFKDLWPHPTSHPLVVNVGGIRQFREVTFTARGVVLGAGITIQQLIAVLKSPAAGAAGDGSSSSGDGMAAAPASTAGVWAAMAEHLERIAGVHVRSAATIGGHFGLCAARPLQTDLGLVLAAAGAQLCVLTVPPGSSSSSATSSSSAYGTVPGVPAAPAAAVWQQQQLDLQWVSVEAFLEASAVGGRRSSSSSNSSSGHSDTSEQLFITEDFIAGAKPVQQQQQQQHLSGDANSHSWTSSSSIDGGSSDVGHQVVTALWLPAGDDAVERFWSSKVALRYVNSHALVNAAVWLRFAPGQPSSACSSGSSGSSGSTAAATGSDTQAAACAAAAVAEARVFVGFPPAAEQGGNNSGSSSSSSKSSSSSSAAVPDESWRVMRLTGVEDALKDRHVDVQVIVAALRAWEATASSVGLDLSGYPAQALQGLLFKALVPLLNLPPAAAEVVTAKKHQQQQQQGEVEMGRRQRGDSCGSSGDGLLRLLQLPPEYDRKQLPEGRQVLPSGEKQAELSGESPVHLPVEKEGVRLQASGEATFVADAAAASGSRLVYVSGVLSTEALAAVDAIDASAALELPEVLGVLTAADVPGSNDVCGSPLLADGVVEWVGQPVALVVAASQAAADVAVKLVQIRYSPLPGRSPIITIDQAVAANAFYCDIPLLSAAAVRPKPSSGGKHRVAFDKEAEHLTSAVDDLIASAPHSITGATYSLPAQMHFYMEPQTAFAEPEEDGAVQVMSAAQSLDAVQMAVAGVLGVPFNKVAAVAKRLGGGFGGKASRSLPVAAAAALAALHFGRPVLFSLNRNVDFAQNPGRCAGNVTYDAGFDENGKLVAIKAQVIYRAGARLELSFNDAAQLVNASDSAFDLSGLAVEVKLARCNLPPHTIVRGPGYLQAVMVLEQVVEHVAAVLGRDPAEVKAANFLSDVSREPSANSSSSSNASSGDGDWLLASADGTCTGAAEAITALDVRPRPCSSLHVSKMHDQQQQQQVVDVKGMKGMHTILGRYISPECYTLPRVWRELLQLSSYHARLDAVRQYNQEHAWSKRGIAVTPVRFDCAPAAVPASISVYADGSVLATHGGIEMGQGLTTKVKQAAVAALSMLLPEEQRPLPLSLVRLAPSSTTVVPNAGPTWSSTASEGNVHAIQLAAANVVAQMKPYVKAASDGLSTWKATLAAIVPDVSFGPAAAMLSAYGFYDGTTGAGSAKQPVAYSAFGAAVTEVELDLLTGERQVLASHIHYDCGFSLNPRIDLGQVEGAFVMGLGAMLCEDVVVDDASGVLLTDSSWSYKIPTPDLMPQQLVVSFLEDAPNPRGILSSKASGEPAVMASVSALMALQQAAAAAVEELGGSGDPGLRVVLTAPATPHKLKAAVGSFSIADRLEHHLLHADLC